MDLRLYNPTPEQIEEAAVRFNYQPFILDDNRHTGVAYSFLHTTDPTRARNGDMLFDRRVLPGDVWNMAYESNRRLATMYDGFIKRVVEVCPPGGSYLDFGCNNGYFPVSASLAGIRLAAGVDLGDFSAQFELLNKITGASAKFSVGWHDPNKHAIQIKDPLGTGPFDVVSTSAVMCHLPDPLHFLKALAGLASHALLIWNNFVESDELLIRYLPPNQFADTEFPNGFDSGTCISTGLLRLSMEKLGFRNSEELKVPPEAMPEGWIRSGCLHAFLFTR